MKNLMIIAVLAASVFTANAQTEWTIDKAHTNIRFSVTHMVVSDVTGNFKMFSGKITSSKEDFTDAQIEFNIDVASINTDNEGRDKHLRSDDFFNAEKYPAITFKSTSFKKISGNKYVLEGDLTIRDITQKVKWDVVYNGTVKDFKGKPKAGFKATTTIDRLAYNLKWNTAVEAGPVVGKEVTIVVDIEVNKQ